MNYKLYYLEVFVGEVLDVTTDMWYVEGMWSPSKDNNAQPFIELLAKADLRNNFKELTGILVKWHSENNTSKLNGLVLGLNDENLVFRILPNEEIVDSLSDKSSR